MEIRIITKMDIHKWIKLSSEFDKYVKELVSDLTEWYNGNEHSPSFEVYMESKINQEEAFMAVDNNDNCLGIIAFSRKRNYITFFAISENMDVKNIGNKLFSYVFTLMDKKKPIYINEINSKSDRIKQYIELFMENGFIQEGHSLENGVPVYIFIKNSV